MPSEYKKMSWEEKYLELKKEFDVLKRKYNKADNVLSEIGSTWPSDLYSECRKCRVYLSLEEDVCSECEDDSDD